MLHGGCMQRTPSLSPRNSRCQDAPHSCFGSVSAICRLSAVLHCAALADVDGGNCSFANANICASESAKLANPYLYVSNGLEASMLPSKVRSMSGCVSPRAYVTFDQDIRLANGGMSKSTDCCYTAA
jgi:hypothetical protein